MTNPKDPFLDELDAEDLAALELALADLPSSEPVPGGRASLLSAAANTHRFEELVEPLAEDADIDAPLAESLLLAIDDAERWSPGPAPWIHLIHFDGGPKTARSITGLVRIDPGQRFPEHGHLGEEVVLILQGQARDTSTGKIYGRGDRVVSGTDVEHAVVVTSDIPLIYLAVVAEGIRLDGEDIPFDDPRA